MAMSIRQLEDRANELHARRIELQKELRGMEGMNIPTYRSKLVNELRAVREELNKNYIYRHGI